MAEKGHECLEADLSRAVEKVWKIDPAAASVIREPIQNAFGLLRAALHDLADPTTSLEAVQRLVDPALNACISAAVVTNAYILKEKLGPKT